MFLGNEEWIFDLYVVVNTKPWLLQRVLDLAMHQTVEDTNTVKPGRWSNIRGIVKTSYDVLQRQQIMISNRVFLHILWAKNFEVLNS